MSKVSYKNVSLLDRTMQVNSTISYSNDNDLIETKRIPKRITENTVAMTIDSTFQSVFFVMSQYLMKMNM